MKTLEQWWQLDLSDESRGRLEALLDAERHLDPDDEARDELLDAFLETLTETQLMLFARLVRELTQEVH